MVHEAPEGSIKNWGDVEKLFLTRFFEDDSKVTMPTLMTQSNERESQSKYLWRDSKYDALMS